MRDPAKYEVDAIIAGGGLAGIHLALAMVRQGLHPLVVDQPDPHSSSRIAAGIINPITGRRFALTWLYDGLEPAFTDVYPYWEKEWKTRFFTRLNIYRSVPGNKLVNDLDAKLMDPAYQRYCRKMGADETKVIRKIINWKPPGYIMKGYQLDTRKFLDHAIAYLTDRRMYVQGQYEIPKGEPEPGPAIFRKYTSDKIVWSTGAAIVHHPFFSWVRMNPNKGEILHLDLPDYQLDKIVKQSAFFVPLPDGGIWVGSYNSWDFPDSTPTPDGLDYLKSKADILQKPFTVAAHHAAVRPTVEDRRPVLGQHPGHAGLYLFNGFGSKGSSLIPYFATQMVAHIFQGGTIHPEADIRRFWEGR